ncbi:MAG: HAD family phosphatase [Pseudomonadota bacterium]
MAGQIKALLFDFGGVFTDSPFHVVADYAKEIGAEPADVAAVVFGSYEQDSEHTWHQLERGEISLEQARDHILEAGARRDLEVDIYTLFGRMAGDPGTEARQPLVDRVRGLRQAGYRTGIITNNVAEFGDGWRSLIPVEELFEFVIDSSSVGVRKPDPRIFQLALAELGHPQPGACVFLDDFAANVEAARALGMHGILVSPDVTEAIAELDGLLTE